MGEQNKEQMDVDDRLIQLEAKLIEQEHRPISLYLNYKRRKSKWGKSDPRSKSARKAILWWFFFSPNTLFIVGGSLITVFTVYFLWQQNKILTSQSQYLDAQFETQKLDLNRSIGSEQKDTYIRFITPVLNDIDSYLESNSNSIESEIPDFVLDKGFKLGRLTEYLEPYFLFIPMQDSSKLISPNRGRLIIDILSRGYPEKTEGTLLGVGNYSYADLRNMSFSENKFIGVDFNHTDFTSGTLQLVSFRFANCDNCIFDRVSTYMIDFRDCNLEKSSYRDASLQRADFRGANLSSSDFSNAFLQNADLRNTLITNTTFYNAKLDGAYVDDFEWLEQFDFSDKNKWLRYKYQVKVSTEKKDTVYRLYPK